MIKKRHSTIRCIYVVLCFIRTLCLKSQKRKRGGEQRKNNYRSHIFYNFFVCVSNVFRRGGGDEKEKEIKAKSSSCEHE